MGSVWIFAICMTFIVLFTGYIAISVNYSKAFRIKSYIVSKIEENNGTYSGFQDEIKTYLTAQGYAAYGECPTYSDWGTPEEINLTNRLDGKANACIYKLEVENSSNDDICGDKYYYKVVTFFKFDLPIVNVLLTFKVSGDTAYVLDDSSC